MIYDHPSYVTDIGDKNKNDHSGTFTHGLDGRLPLVLGELLRTGTCEACPSSQLPRSRTVGDLPRTGSCVGPSSICAAWGCFPSQLPRSRIVVDLPRTGSCAACSSSRLILCISAISRFDLVLDIKDVSQRLSLNVIEHLLKK